MMDTRSEVGQFLDSLVCCCSYICQGVVVVVVLRVQDIDPGNFIEEGVSLAIVFDDDDSMGDRKPDSFRSTTSICPGYIAVAERPLAVPPYFHLFV